MTFTNFLFLVAGIYAIYYFSMIIYDLFFRKKTADNFNDFKVGNYQEEEPILVTEDYIYEQSGLTKKEYEQRMALYENSRKKQMEDFRNEGKKKPKRERSVDDDLGMSF